MKYLTLFRHAKSGWDDPVARDFDRALNARGKRAAEMMGRFAAKQGMAFDQMISSPAVRCAETLDGFFVGYGQTIEPSWDRRIYLASSATLIDVIRETPATTVSLIMVGHNPGLEDVILDTVPDDGSSPLRALVEAKFPTASIAVLALESDSWTDLGKAPVKLVAFTRPRDLDPQLGPEDEDY
jgi:phosphohistidine phosphatase